MKLEKQVKICKDSSIKNEICPHLYWNSNVKCKYRGEKVEHAISKIGALGYRIGGYRMTYTCKK